MNILILGCSYGVPNYYGPPGVPPEHHIELLLKSQGHTVHNCSLNGGSNMQSLARAHCYLNGESILHPTNDKKFSPLSCKNVGRLDLIIWFHTELVRDKESPEIVYQCYSDFFNVIKTKIAVIGGAGDIEADIHQYFTPDFFIPSWRRLILQNSLPLTNTLSSADSIDSSEKTKEEKLQTVIDNLSVIRAMHQSPHFPDDSHPGTWPHQDLLQRLMDAKLIF